MATLHHAPLDNTCCPMCGRGIETGMREVILRLGDGSLVSLRVDSERCAKQVTAWPDASAAAARVNQIAQPPRRPRRRAVVRLQRMAR